MLKETTYQSDARRILLDKYLRGEFAREPSPKPTAEREGTVRASLSQEQLWLQSEEYAIPEIYTESITIHRTATLDLNVLKQSLREILRRHDLWRTRFEMSGGHLHQVVGEAAEFPLTVVDLRGWPAHERERKASMIGNAQARQPFNLSRGPLVRATIVTLGDQQHRLYIDMHQIITDGISAFQLLPTELATLYDSFLTGSPSTLPELAWQFADYAAWQREWLQGAALQTQLEYWRGRFALQSSLLHWPNDGVRPPLETHRAKIEPFALSWEALDELQTVRKSTGISLFASLVAVFTALLHCYSQQHDFVLGTLAPSGRHRTEFQNLLGYFMNPVPLQFQISSDLTFRELMMQAQEVVCGAISHGDVPFEQAVKAIGKQPVPGHYPLFRTGISLAPAVTSLPPGWDMTSMDVESGAGRWGLYLVMSERREHLMGRAQYNPDVFTQATIAALLDDFRKLVEIAGVNPDHRLSDLLTAANVRNPEKPR
jgi:hypothetical protein